MNPTPLIVLLAASSALAQEPVWTLRDVPGPGGRMEHAMAFDSARAVAVLYGGVVSGWNTDTWEWNGVSWTQRSVPGPGVRIRHAMAYDSARGVTVLYGGLLRNGNMFEPNGETWEWNGTAWTLRSSGGPGPRQFHAMAFDASRGVTVVQGGVTSMGLSNQTWEWNGVTWSLRNSNAAMARTSSAMAYDTARGVTTLFGGYRSPPLSDTWEWNGSAWTQRLVSGPTARYGHCMAHDALRGVTVLYGGFAGSAAESAETWEWNGAANAGAGQWTLLPVSGPPPLRAGAMVFDSVRGEIMMHGGQDPGVGITGQTWVLAEPMCDGDVNCDGNLDGFDVEIMERATGGQLADFCQADPDFNGDGNLDGFDVEAVELVTGGGPCP